MKAERRAKADERSVWVDRIADVERRVGAVMQEYVTYSTGQPSEAPTPQSGPMGKHRPVKSRALRFQSEGDAASRYSPPLRIGEHGKISRTYLGAGVWRAEACTATVTVFARCAGHRLRSTTAKANSPKTR